MKLKTILNEVNKKYDYGCAMLYFDFAVEDIHNKINKDDLYIKSGDSTFGLETEPHCTLLYGLHSDVTINHIKSIIDKYKFYDCLINNISLFKHEEFDVLKFDVIGEPLAKVNKELTGLPHTTSYPDFHPHLTIAYLKSGMGDKYVNMLNQQKYIVKPSHVIYSYPSGKKTKIKINYGY
jgi:2'-5' RNA ligase